MGRLFWGKWQNAGVCNRPKGALLHAGRQERRFRADVAAVFPPVYFRAKLVGFNPGGLEELGLLLLPRLLESRAGDFCVLVQAVEGVVQMSWGGGKPGGGFSAV